MNRTAVLTLWVAWAVTTGLSVVALMEAPSGDGFTRGMNRLTGFLGWQSAGGILAIVLWIGVRPRATGDGLRWLGRLPLLWSGALFLLIAVWIAIRLIGAEIGHDGRSGSGSPR